MQQKYSRLFLPSFLILFISCGTANIGPYTVNEVIQFLDEDDFTFLTAMDADSAPWERLVVSDAGILYFSSYKLEKHGYPSLAMDWLIKGLEVEEPYSSLALKRILKLLKEEKSYEHTLHLLNSLPSAFSNSDELTWLRLEALYWLREDLAAFELLSRMQEAGYFSKADDEIRAEAWLFDLVLRYRLGHPDVEENIFQFFNTRLADRFHIRFVDYLVLQDHAYRSFSDDLQALVLAKNYHARQDYASSFALLDTLLEEQQHFTQANLRDWRIAGTELGLYTRMVSRIDMWKIENADKPFFAEETAWFYRYFRNYAAAQRAFWQKYTMTSNERFLWYWADSLLKQDFAFLVDAFPELCLHIQNPEYFDDLLEELLFQLCERHSFDTLAKLYTQHSLCFSRAMKATWARVILLLHTDSKMTLNASEFSAVRQSILEYGNARGIGFVSYLEETDYIYGKLDSFQTDSSPRYPEKDKIAFMYMQHELKEALTDYVFTYKDYLSKQTLTASVQYIQNINPYRGISLAVRLFSNAPYWCADLLKLKFPQAYRDEVETAAQRFGIPPYLLFALVRQESLFHPEIVSHAGAVGLSQLMPATAAEAASMLKMENYDIRNPVDNLTIGAFYLSRMYRQFGSWAAALWAYNAGPGRMSQWMRRNPHSLILFAEQIPIKETRQYLMRINESIFFYAALYYDTPANIVHALLYSEP